MRWSVVIPVYNELGFLERTLASLTAQTLLPQLIIVDNGSTDGCIESAKAQLGEAGVRASFLSEPQPGQVHALRAGIDAVRTEFVAICDADTYYPPHYLARADALFRAGSEDLVALGAWLKPDQGTWVLASLEKAHHLLAARIMPRQNHTSGAGQAFRTSALRSAGGYDPQRWPYVLKDHELSHRVLKLGYQRYDAELWCMPSTRRNDRRGVRWTLMERILYHVTPPAAKDWFFYSFLRARFERRGQRDTVLRQRAWDAAP